MLVLTQQAVDAIRTIVEESGVGPNGGLRISSQSDADGEQELEFGVEPEPSEGDEVVREAGAVVFLDRAAAAALADKTLDVHAHDDHFHFSLDD